MQVAESLPPESADPAPGWLLSERLGERWLASAGGGWNMTAPETLEAAVATVLERFRRVGAGLRSVALDLSSVAALDTVGAVLLHRIRLAALAEGLTFELVGARPAHAALLEAVWPAAETPPPVPAGRSRFAAIAALGRGVCAGANEAAELIAFFGRLVASLTYVLLHPSRIRYNAITHHIRHVGLEALPILGLLAFMIGVVIAFQGAEQLAKVGIESLVVHLIGLTVLREIGSLITAIIVAGRSGSAFTAQIGAMKVNQEVDAMQAIGLDPMEILVLPRIFALLVVMPLLTFFANAMALLGGAVVAYALFDINLVEFLSQMRVPLDLYDASVGLLKSPAFAVVIALVGCHEGMRVSGNAESVGLHTTRSVVLSLFLVMLLNALFSVLFTALGI